MMLDWMKKRKWLALVMVMCMILTILPTDFSWADNVIGVNTEESTQSSSSESDGGITEVTTEALTEGTEDLSSEGTEDVSKVTEDVSKVTEAVSSETETASLEEAEPALLKSSETATESDQSELPVVGEETKEDLLGASEMMIKQDGTSNFQLTKLELSASYKDKNNETHIVEMNTTEGVTLPDNASISLNFDFLMYNGNTVEIGKEYIYEIPSDIRIDVNETLELITNDGKSIGTVKIDQANSQLVFVFNHNVDNQVNIPFYVRFAGGLSADVEEEAKDVEISFATATGHFDYNVKVEDSYNKPTPTEPGDLEMTKSGNKVTIDGKQYIEWNLSLNLNGRDSLNAEISDMLPEGLDYADVTGYPKLEGTKYGQTPSISKNVNGKQVSFNVSNVTADYRANVKFLTTYNSNIFTDTITENSSATVANTAAILEEGTNTPVYATGNAVVSPKLLSKSGTVDGDEIKWTVVINSDQMDLGSAEYQDTFGSGISWPGGSFDASKITVDPLGAGSFTGNANGFTFKPNSGYKNQEITLIYNTKMDNVMLDKYENTGKLTDNSKYNVTSKATVPGFDLFEKQNVSYNEVTKQLTWKIIVNKDKQDVFGINDVTITDTFNPRGFKQNKMELKKMEITSATGDNNLSAFSSCTADLSAGTITVPGEKLNGTTLEITVVTHILDDKNPNASYDSNWEDKWKDGDWVSATNNATLAWNSQTIPASSNKGFQYKAPDLITKTGSQPKYNDGSVKGDGTIEWTLLVTTFQEDTKTNQIVLTDTLPEGTKYVPGSLYMNKRWDGTKYSMEPTISGNTLSLTLDRTNGNVAACLDERNYFEIHYKTVVTDKDKAKADTSYTNQAEVTVNYEGDATVTDKDEDTVSGVLGGELRKEAIYQSGKNYVDWEVAINEGRFDMSDVSDPVIRDKLADYLQYVDNSGTLYKVAENGSRTKVTSDFLVNVINNEMVVSLPNIGSDMYVFAFQTKFTVSQAQAATLDFSNNISFSGTGQSQSVSSNKVKNVSFSSSSAGAYHENELRLVKVDSTNGSILAGAVFELKDSKGNVLARETSGTDGVAVFKGVKLSSEGYTYAVKEVTSPEGYKISTADIPISVSEWKTDSNGIRYYAKEIPNTPKTQTTTFSLVKTSTEGGKMLAGAEFSVYSDTTWADDKLVNAKETDTTGKVTFDVEYNNAAATTYYVKETKTPDGYAKPSTDEYYEVTIATNDAVTVKKHTNSATTDVTVTDKSFTVTNTPVHGSFKITKVKEGTLAGLQGASFTIYKDKQCSDDVSTQTTGGDGTVTFNNLEIGRTYYYKEVEAPTGYILDQTVYSVTIDDASKRDPDGTIHKDITLEKTLENKLALGAVKIKKTDNGVPAKALKGAEFTLYSVGVDGNETVYNIPPSGGSSGPYKVTTDDNGEAVFKDLPFGNYVIKETNVPTGYKTSVTGDTPVTINTVDTKNVTIINDVITFTLKIVKKDDSNNNLPGAYFVVRNSQGVRVAGGETSDDGTLTFEDLPYDTYTITETRGVAGYTMAADPQTVAKADITDGANIEKTFTNVKQKGKITFTKKDSDDSSTLQNAEFSLYKDDGSGNPGEFVKKETSNTSGTVTFSNLAFGKYVIKETKAPANYQINTDTWTVTVNSNEEITQVYSVSASSNTGDITDVKIPSGQNYMHFTLRKADEKGQPIKGARFTLTKNFVNPSDGTNDTNGAPKTYTAYSNESGVVSFIDVYIEHDADTTTYTLEETGVPYGYTSSKTVIFDKMSKTDIINKVYTTTYPSTTANPSTDTTATYYDLNKVEDITDKVDYPYLVTASGNNYIKNQQIKGNFLITKKASSSVNTFLQGAEFTLYKLDPTDNTYKLYKPNGYTNPKETDAKGLLNFGDLVLGKYRVVETNAPAGYILNTANQKDFEVTEANYNNQAALSATISNAPYSISVSKYEVGGSTQLKGAELGLYKVSDTGYTNCLDKWTTTNNPHKLPAAKITAGTEYMIHELKAPAGYCVSPEDVKFRVNTDGTVTYTGTLGSQYGSASGTNVILRDKKLSLYIDKRGVDTTGGSDIALSGASISILDNATNKVVVTFTSTTSKYEVPMGVLTGPSGTADYHKYTIRENSAPGGYAMAEDIVIAIDKEGNIHKVDADGTVSSNTWADNTVKMVDTEYKDFYFAKRDKTTGDALIGATFGIYEASVWEGNSDRTTNTSYATDTTGVTLKWKSTAVAKNVSLATGEYYFVELEAPVGYELEEPIKFKVVDTGADTTGDKIEIIGEAPNSNLSANQLMLTSRDSAIEVRFVKWSKSLQPLTGGKFSVHASDNKKTVGAKIGESFSAEGSAITLDSSYFELGKYYAIVEEQAPVGYTVTSPQFFRIGMDGKVYDLDGNLIDNHLLIFIDELNPICINKVDAETGTPISGVELTISSENPRFQDITWVTDGTNKYLALTDFTEGETYTLTETKTVNGYAYADSITFKYTTGTKDELYVNGVKMNTMNIMMEDKPYTIPVDKYILGTTKHLAGAALQVVDDGGNVVESWTTDDTTHVLDASKYMASKTPGEHMYKLMEVSAPELYARAPEIEFYINRDGQVCLSDDTPVAENNLIMYDDFLGVAISKQDFAGNEIPGAKLTITSKEDGTFTPITWVSTTTPYNIDREKFKPGVTYTLTETAAPNGYAYAESIDFMVDEDGNVFVNGKPVTDKTIVMVDGVLTLNLAKKVEGSDRYLAGATFGVYEVATGKQLFTFTSKDGLTEMDTKLLRTSHGEESVFYLLRELEAPVGFELAPDTYFYFDEKGALYVLNEDKTVFALAADQTITVFDAPSTTSGRKTGDVSPIRALGMMFFLSLAGLGSIMAMKRLKIK